MEGPITNKIKNKNWKEKVNKFKLDPTLDWKVAEVIQVNNNDIKFETLNDKKILLVSSNLKISNGL